MRTKNILKNTIGYLLIGTIAGSLVFIIPMMLIMLFNNDINSFNKIMQFILFAGFIYGYAFVIGCVPATITGVLMCYERFFRHGPFNIGFCVSFTVYLFATFAFYIYIFFTQAHRPNIDDILSYLLSGVLFALILATIGGVSSVISVKLLEKINTRHR